MAHISRARTFATDPQTIWDVLADFGAISAWADGIDHSCLLRVTAEPVGLTRRVQMGRIVLTERIIEFDAPGTLAYDIEGLPPFAGRVRNRWDLHPLSAQSTEVSLTTSVDIGSRLPQRLAERAVCRVTAQKSDGLLAGLATHLEGTHA
ncbi:MAG: SRPBCC family protein [Mycobacterium sp.]